MDNMNKGKSPFYPGQPVPIEFFSGRIPEIERVLRSVNQVGLGKPQAIFVVGDYGIGKSSLAGFIRDYSEKNSHLLGIHVLLGGAESLDDVATKTVEAVIKTQIYEATTTEKVRDFLSKYIGKQELFGLSINLEVLKSDGPNLSHGYLPFLRELLERVKDNGVKGIILILDEINGITKNPQFSHFIKSLVDENALSRNPLPLMLMLCGVEERRLDMITHHQPIERIFDIIEIKPMTKPEMTEFFNKAFGTVNMKVENEAMQFLCHYSAGFPKIMHIIGDAVFWMDKDNVISKDDVLDGVFVAAEEVGKKFVDQQVYAALHSKDYHSILTKIGKENFSLSFRKSDIEKGLSESEKKKFNNFLQRMKKLNVLKSGDELGEYIFNSYLVRLYILLNSHKERT
ncbi:MAG: ATP-binding protein [Candidatus Omnitrophota bacterium]